jgi:hypothetical protein
MNGSPSSEDPSPPPAETTPHPSHLWLYILVPVAALAVGLMLGVAIGRVSAHDDDGYCSRADEASQQPASDLASVIGGKFVVGDQVYEWNIDVTRGGCVDTQLVEQTARQMDELIQQEHQTATTTTIAASPTTAAG